MDKVYRTDREMLLRYLVASRSMAPARFKALLDVATFPVRNRRRGDRDD